MFLDYLALVILLAGLLMVFYVFVYIHDLPYNIAKSCNHPHAEAIHTACWLSLFTLHAIWPIVFIWSKTHQPDTQATTAAGADGRITDLEARIRKLENPSQ